MKVRSKRVVLMSLAAATLVASLSACVPLVVGGGFASGVMVAMDRRTSGAQLEDQGIELRGANRLKEALGENARVNVTSYNRQVLLTGEVARTEDIQRAEQIVAKVENVNSVVNDLAVGIPAALTQRSTDLLITSKVKASLIDAKDLQASAFKVLTERNVVYLMGRVTPREANRATEIARGVKDVAKVVRVFETLTEEELARLGQQPPAK
ncbi:BON domain-containing protein [Pseudorhodoferax soli]|jgi:osmotically-inducible protein OsmY|uniref:Osmotically-inducible protein OsmY n=1 Tax=Pseudorhodoferax soli TaxID=545864 RepID=A0A368Y3H6_9BURK|nr:BON domain-containing protein [Pseudorhodoferax soli]RCW74655.1 osmotically-inducible protein OsmY [Pseudorhodoferax soli]